MAEDTAVLLISRRIGGNLAQLDMISGIGGLVEHDAVFGVQFFLYAVQGFFGFTGLHTDAGQDTEALGLNKDLAFFTFLGTDLVAEGVVGTQEPFAVPAVRENGLFHGFLLSQNRGRFVCQALELAQIGVFLGVFDEHASDEDGFSHRPFAGT